MEAILTFIYLRLVVNADNNTIATIKLCILTETYYFILIKTAKIRLYKTLVVPV